MKLKLDENLGRRGADLFQAAGHDVATVAGQGLSSASDDRLADVCRGESRCLVTLDLDFSNPFLYPPWESAGIAVLRLPPKPSADDLRQLCRLLCMALRQGDIRGKLWIIQPGRIREYRPDRDDE
jgi:hypothetical protein